MDTKTLKISPELKEISSVKRKLGNARVCVRVCARVVLSFVVSCTSPEVFEL